LKAASRFMLPLVTIGIASIFAAGCTHRCGAILRFLLMGWGLGRGWATLRKFLWSSFVRKWYILVHFWHTQCM